MKLAQNFAAYVGAITFLLAVVAGKNLNAIAPTAHAIDALHVRLLPGSPFFDRQELHRTKFLASWDPDQLLFHYRQVAGLPQANGAIEAYPGWECGFIRGHLVGHYLSAASRMYVATGDQKYRDRATYIVAELGKCQAAINEDGYLAARAT